MTEGEGFSSSPPLLKKNPITPQNQLSLSYVQLLSTTLPILNYKLAVRVFWKKYRKKPLG